MVVLAFLKLLGCLGLLMYGTKLMGESLLLDSLTTNRFTSLLTGALVTAMILSSTAASLMTVSFVHAGMLTFMQALPALMGASVGNTLVAWLMAAELNFEFSNYIYPLMLAAFMLVQYRKRPALGESVFGFCFILLSLGLICHLYDSMPAADQHTVTEDEQIQRGHQILAPGSDAIFRRGVLRPCGHGTSPYRIGQDDTSSVCRRSVHRLFLRTGCQQAERSKQAKEDIYRFMLIHLVSIVKIICVYIRVPKVMNSPVVREFRHQLEKTPLVFFRLQLPDADVFVSSGKTASYLFSVLLPVIKGFFHVALCHVQA